MTDFEKEIEIIERKLSTNFFRNINEAITLKTSLYYEKIMLENYYKVRTLSADTYFTDSSSRESFDEIVVDDFIYCFCRTFVCRFK